MYYIKILLYYNNIIYFLILQTIEGQEKRILDFDDALRKYLLEIIIVFFQVFFFCFILFFQSQC